MEDRLRILLSPFCWGLASRNLTSAGASWLRNTCVPVSHCWRPSKQWQGFLLSHRFIHLEFLILDLKVKAVQAVCSELSQVTLGWDGAGGQNGFALLSDTHINLHKYINYTPFLFSSLSRPRRFLLLFRESSWSKQCWCHLTSLCTIHYQLVSTEYTCAVDISVLNIWNLIYHSVLADLISLALNCLSEVTAEWIKRGTLSSFRRRLRSYSWVILKST